MSRQLFIANMFLLMLYASGCDSPSAPSNQTGRPHNSAAANKPSVAEMTNEQFIFEVRKLTDKNDFTKSIEMLSERIQLHPDDVSLKKTLLSTKIQHGESIARLGDLTNAAVVMKEVGELGREIYSGDESGANNVDFVAALLCEARAYAFESNVEACVNALQSAIELGYGNLDVLKRDPFFGKLRSSDRYAEMLDQMLESNASKGIRAFEPVAFDFSLEDLNGAIVNLSDSAGKIRVVNVWGTWCGPCLTEIPSFVQLQKRFSSDIKVIGINIERTESAAEARRLVQSVVDNLGINYQCVLGKDDTTKTIPGFSAFPTTLFVDRVGQVRMRLNGSQSYDKLASVVEFLVAEQ